MQRYANISKYQQIIQYHPFWVQKVDHFSRKNSLIACQNHKITQENFYTMAYGLLKGKRGIISGALNEDSIAWKIAQRAHEEGATFTLTNAPLAMRMGEINKLAEETGAKIIGADATSIDEL